MHTTLMYEKGDRLNPTPPPPNPTSQREESSLKADKDAPQHSLSASVISIQSGLIIHRTNLPLRRPSS